jgi:hypothetical protein
MYLYNTYHLLIFLVIKTNIFVLQIVFLVLFILLREHDKYFLQQRKTNFPVKITLPSQTFDMFPTAPIYL